MARMDGHDQLIPYVRSYSARISLGWLSPYSYSSALFYSTLLLYRSMKSCTEYGTAPLE